MSRQNPIYAALCKIRTGEITQAEFLAVWNDKEITTEYRGNFFTYVAGTEPTRQLSCRNSDGRAVATGLHPYPVSVMSADFWATLNSYALYDGFMNEPDLEWAPAYLKGKSWVTLTVFVWTAYVMKAGLSQDETKQLAKLRELQYPVRDLGLCAVTGALIPDDYGAGDYVEGRSKFVLNRGLLMTYLFRKHPLFTKWVFIPQIEFRDPRNAARRNLFFGYTSVETERRPIRLASDLVYTVPVHALTNEFMAHQCPACTYWVPEYLWEEATCKWCIETRYPDCVVRGYSENALNYVKVQISTKKPFTLPRDQKFMTPILMGCELEYNCNESKSLSARRIFMKHLEKFVIFKHDGSLSSGGFEVVTAPADIGMHKEKFLPMFKEFPTFLEITENTGMHVHLDRNALSPLMLGRLVDFMHNPDNKDYLENIAERRLIHYCAQIGLGYRNVLERSPVNRYASLNIAPANTVEFRIFKSPSTYESFIKNLEFIQALVQFFRTGWTSITPKEGRKFPIFLDYLKSENRSKLEARNTSHFLMQHLKAGRII